MSITRQPRRGVTLIELMVVVAVLAVLVVVAAPSVRKLLDVQRMRGISAELTTDLQFVRAEAASRQEHAGISFRFLTGNKSCYTLHTCGSASISPVPPLACACDCNAAAGSRCPPPTTGQPDPPREIKTVTILANRGIAVGPTSDAGLPFSDARVLFDPVTGALSSYYPIGFLLPPVPPSGNFVGTTRLIAPAAATGAIRTEVNLSGRPRTCKGIAPC